MTILAIDTSCDETSAAIIVDGCIMSNVLFSQVEFHKAYGGVLPSLARKLDQEHIDRIIHRAYIYAHITKKDLTHIAVTQGPGLAITLEVGIEKAKELAQELSLPLIPINHMEGHLYAAFARNSLGKGQIDKPNFPYLVLLVSGKHTELVIMHDHNKYEKIGEVLDDAVGEAFDKVGRMLGLGYPAGPLLAKFAEKGDGNHFTLPIPMKHSLDFNFSYSGLKTAVMHYVDEEKKKGTFTAQTIYDLAASFQYVAIEQILIKTRKALQKYPIINGIVIGGGVSANIMLRKKARTIGKEFNIPVYFPLNKKLCMDNGGMIGTCAYWKVKTGSYHPLPFDQIERIPRLSF